MDDVTKYLKEFLTVLPGKLADGLKQSKDELAVYISDNMKNGANPNPNKTRTDSDPRLYVNGGRLLKAATVPNDQGNVTEVRLDGDEIVWEAGVDLDVVPYARIHEYGGSYSIVSRRTTINMPARPYLEPGVRDYIEDDNSGLSATLDELMEKVRKFLE